MYKYKDLKQDYGENLLHKIRVHEKLSKQAGRCSSHIRFNLQCKHTSVIPKNVRIKSQMKTPEAKRIIERAEKALLNLRITENNKTKVEIVSQKKRIENELTSCVPNELYKQIVENNNKKQRNELEKYSVNQKNKYYKLRYGRDYKNTSKASNSHPHQQAQIAEPGMNTSTGGSKTFQNTNFQIMKKPC